MPYKGHRAGDDRPAGQKVHFVFDASRARSRSTGGKVKDYAVTSAARSPVAPEITLGIPAGLRH
jgi:hypothetical protein